MPIMDKACRISSGLAATALVWGLAGCVAVPRDRPLLHPLAAEALLPPDAPALAINQQWWQALGDPQLDRIMSDALAGNPGLDLAAARLRQAQQVIGIAHAGLEPRIGIDAQETGERLSGKYIIPPPYAGTARWVGTVQAGLSWSLDVAGRQKALVDAARAQANGAGFDLAAARIVLSGAVAQAYLNLRRAGLQASIADRFVASREDQARLARSRRSNALGSDFDLRAAETLLAEARQARVRADGERAMMVHALAALAGQGLVPMRIFSPRWSRWKTPPPCPTICPPICSPAAPMCWPRRPAWPRRRRACGSSARVSIPTSISRPLPVSRRSACPRCLRAAPRPWGRAPRCTCRSSRGRLRASYRAAVAGQDVAIAQYNAAVLGAVREAADALSAIETNQRATAQQQVIEQGLADTVRLDEARARGPERAARHSRRAGPRAGCRAKAG
jgi:outer membrane protein TolC